jgi:hypothetical protein
MTHVFNYNYLICPTLGVPDADVSSKLLSASYKLRNDNEIKSFK